MVPWKTGRIKYERLCEYRNVLRRPYSKDALWRRIYTVRRVTVEAAWDLWVMDICHVHKGSQIIPILIKPVPWIDTYFFKIYFNIIPVGLPVKIWKTILSSSTQATCPTNLDILDLNVLNATNYEIPHCEPFRISLLKLKDISLFIALKDIHSSSLLYLNINLRILF